MSVYKTKHHICCWHVMTLYEHLFQFNISLVSFIANGFSSFANTRNLFFFYKFRLYEINIFFNLCFLRVFFTFNFITLCGQLIFGVFFNTSNVILNVCFIQDPIYIFFVTFILIFPLNLF